MGAEVPGTLLMLALSPLSQSHVGWPRHFPHASRQASAGSLEGLKDVPTGETSASTFPTSLSGSGLAAGVYQTSDCRDVPLICQGVSIAVVFEAVVATPIASRQTANVL